MEFDIPSIHWGLESTLQYKLDQLASVPGGLGLLERLALRIGLIQNSPAPRLNRPTLLICAADHGVVAAGIGPTDAEHTLSRVRALLAGTTAINALTRANGLELLVVDAGLELDCPGHERLIDARIAPGTRNYVQQPAMEHSQCEQALNNGVALIDQLHQRGGNVVGFGALGAGGPASAALLMSLFCKLPLERCVGPGAGLDEVEVYHLVKVLRHARERITSNRALRDPLTVLTEFSGFEIVTLCGAMLRAAERGMVILVDGFVTTGALLAARAINPRVMDYCIASHRSEEVGHNLMLQQLHARPLLDLRLQPGEGLGAVLAWPLVNSAAALLNEPARVAGSDPDRADDD